MRRGASVGETVEYEPCHHHNYQLPATRRFTRGAPAAPAAPAIAAAPSKGERSTSPGRPESPGYAISLATLPDVFLSPSILSSSDVTGMESGIDPEPRTPT